MTAYTSFVTMTKPEARAYLEQFLEEMPACMGRLTVVAASTGGPGRAELDYTPESLDVLHAWAVPRFAWRASYQPPAFRGDSGTRLGPDDLEDPEDLPSWLHHPSGQGFDRFSAETLWLIDGLARYLGETVVNCVPGARWASGATRPKGNMVANQPILAGLSDEESPILACTGLASRKLTPWLDDSHTVRSIFESWRSGAAAVTSRRTEGMNDEARELSHSGDLFEVLDNDHPDFSLYISIDDEIAHEYDATLDRLVDELADAPDVVRAIREEREVILVGGTIAAPALEAWLAGWWRSALRAQPPRDRD